jgi:hypothetical protein
MRNRLQLGTMYYLVLIGLIVYGVGVCVAMRKIESKLIVVSGTIATPSPTPWWLYGLLTLPVLQIVGALIAAALRRSRRKRPKHCRNCGRWIGDDRRCVTCGVASAIYPVSGRGFRVVPPTASLAEKAH